MEMIMINEIVKMHNRRKIPVKFTRNNSEFLLKIYFHSENSQISIKTSIVEHNFPRFGRLNLISSPY